MPYGWPCRSHCRQDSGHRFIVHWGSQTIGSKHPPGFLTLDESSKSISNTNSFYSPQLPTSENKVLLLAFSLRFFLSSPCCISWLLSLLDKELPQASHCQVSKNRLHGIKPAPLLPKHLARWAPCVKNSGSQFLEVQESNQVILASYVHYLGIFSPSGPVLLFRFYRCFLCFCR